MTIKTLHGHSPSVYPYVRMLRVIFAARKRSRITLEDSSTVAFRVLPGDLDNAGHMTNGRYLTMMDLARYDILVRGGIARELLRRKWMPVVASSTIRYRRSLQPFERYHIETQVVGWDARAFFIRQKFLRGEELVAVGTIRGVFRHGRETIVPREVLVLTGYDAPEEKMPEWVRAWQGALSMGLDDEKESAAVPVGVPLAVKESA